MKKPNFYKKAIAWIIITFFTFLLCGGLLGPWLQSKTGMSIGLAALIGYTPLVVVGYITLNSLEKASTKSLEWVRNHGLKQADSVVLKSVDGRKPIETDFRNPDPDAKYLFEVQHGLTFLPVTFSPKDPEFQDLMRKTAGSRLARDSHILRTQIIAVNNKTFTDTRQRLRIPASGFQLPKLLLVG